MPASKAARIAATDSSSSTSPQPIGSPLRQCGPPIAQQPKPIGLTIDPPAPRVRGAAAVDRSVALAAEGIEGVDTDGEEMSMAVNLRPADDHETGMSSE